MQRVLVKSCTSYVSPRIAKSTRSRKNAVCAAAVAKTTVVVTREKGKNDKLIKALSKHDIECIELPLIEHAVGPDRDRLPVMLQSGSFDWVAVTSPEAATVFLEGWKAAGSPKVRIAVVGGGTGEVLQQAGLEPEFTASKATGKTMGGELPQWPGGNNSVLYPASLRASTDLQDSLAASGFNVTRINTYDTVSVSHVEPSLLARAAAAPIITFGSPSAVKAWVGLVGHDVAQRQVSVCIGSTSARVCEGQGLTRIYYPEAPGIQGWVDKVLQACRDNNLLPVAV